MSELRQFEGRSRYCGEPVYVIAEDQKKADQAAPEQCECEGSIEMRRYEDIIPKVNEMLSRAPELDEDLKAGICLMVKSVITGEIDSCNIKTSWEKIIIKARNDKIVITRREVKDREVLV